MDVAFDDRGLVPAVVQDAGTRRVLMVAYLNAEALEATIRTGQAHFWSRSRSELWRKGATSGNTLAVLRIQTDCDGDALLIEVTPAGPACHTGAETCFGDAPEPPARSFGALDRLWTTIADRCADRPAGSYTASLVAGGVDATSRKVLEEAGELAFAAKDHAAGVGEAQRISEEAADLLYHVLVLLAERGVAPGGTLQVLAARER
jgi:phosphoribosyl-ATP pyrophosphohydrolase/phosphoribosyl-AMP cyclohydrolase